LAAILAADVVGYSALMERAEEATYAEIGRLRREVIEPGFGRHRGRLIKTTGDGILAEFASPLAAVKCGLEIQDHLASHQGSLQLRIGINLGDMIVDEQGDVYGDRINVAARLESLADPGGILISGKVHSEVEGKLDVGFEDRGEQQLKNISKPVRAYAVRAGACRAPTERLSAAPPLPDRPSIAVLPFQNMSGDPKQEYFADGMVEDIITALSRFKSLFVIARNSTFTYKGKAVDIKQVGRQLGVRYVLEGSVRKSANRLRITGQLLDTASGAHLWADRFDGEVGDIFDLQDKVAESVVGAIAPAVERAEIERAKHKPTESLDAYDQFLRGIAKFHQSTKEANTQALALFSKAIELDPEFAAAYGMAAWCYVRRKANGWMTNFSRAQEVAEAERLARLAIALGKDDAVAMCTGGYTLAYGAHDLDAGGNSIDRALVLNPNLAWAWLYSGWNKVWLGDAQDAIARVTHSIRLSPLDAFIFGMFSAMAWAHFLMGQYDEASS
jgi:adenylate cyclase